MELAPDTVLSLVKYLVAHGYPEESLSIEHPIGQYRVDLAVLDLATKSPILIFEVKSQQTKQTEQLGRKQLDSVLRELGDMSIPAYLVYPRMEEPYFALWRVRLGLTPNERNKFIHSDAFLNYKLLQSNWKNKAFAKFEKDKNSAIDWFQKGCWGASGIILLLCVLDYIRVVAISEKHLMMLGASIGLFIIPYAGKLKILGMEFERARGRS